MMTVDEVREALRDRNIQMVAKHTKLNPHTIYRLVQGERTPLYDTVKVLSDYLSGEKANG